MKALAISCLAQVSLLRQYNFFLFFYVPALLKYNRQTTLDKFKVCYVIFDIYCEMIITLESVNTAITSHRYHVWGKNTLRSILNKLQISHTTLLTAVTMLHIRPPGRTHNWKLVPFDSMESWSSAVTKACMPSSRHSLSQVFRHFSFLTVFKRTSRMLFFSIFFNAASKSTGHCYPLWTQPSLVPRPCHAPRVASRPRQQPPPPQWRGTSPEPWGARGLDLS